MDDNAYILGYETGIEAGRREVVEWINDWNFWDNLSSDILEEWQAKLKKWGIVE